MNVSQIKKIGNLKFFNNEQSKFTKLDKTFLKNINLKKIWCASSTHPGEEIICANTHIKLKKKYKNLFIIKDNKKDEDKSKTIQELDREKLEQKFSKETKETLN